VIGLDRIVLVLLDVVPRRRHQFFEHGRVDRCGVGDHLARRHLRKLQRSSHRSVKDLKLDVTAWVEAWNADPKPFGRVKTADEILDSLAAYCTRINQLSNDSGHLIQADIVEAAGHCVETSWASQLGSRVDDDVRLRRQLAAAGGPQGQVGDGVDDLGNGFA